MESIFSHSNFSDTKKGIKAHFNDSSNKDTCVVQLFEYIDRNLIATLQSTKSESTRTLVLFLIAISEAFLFSIGKKIGIRSSWKSTTESLIEGLLSEKRELNAKYSKSLDNILKLFIKSKINFQTNQSIWKSLLDKKMSGPEKNNSKTRFDLIQVQSSRSISKTPPSDHEIVINSRFLYNFKF